MLIINNHKTGIENIEISRKMWAIGHDRGMNSNNNKKKIRDHTERFEWQTFGFPHSDALMLYRSWRLKLVPELCHFWVQIQQASHKLLYTYHLEGIIFI